MTSPEPPRSIADLAVERGRDALSFLAVESGMRHWFDAPPPEGTGACVSYVDTSGAWVAACSPLVEASPEACATELSRAALRFVEAAREQGRRACFFACEDPALDGLSRMLIGQQPVFHPREWLRGLSGRRRLREQLRRARAKGLVVRVVAPAELAERSSLRLEVERLAGDWLRARHIEPMGFLVALELFQSRSRHRYLVAELGGRAVGFLSAVPIGQRRAWLVEDVVRSRSAPNGTTETLLVALMREVEESEYVTLGLTPLAGAVAWPLRVARWISRPLFDFQGLRAFRERLHPHAWQPVWLVYPSSGSPVVSLFDSLRAFARGPLVGFGLRSFARHPSGLPWALALPLPLWTASLAWLVAVHRASLLGFPRSELALWVAFDALLLLVLVRVAMRPRRSRLLVATSLAFVDALLSLGHLAWVGFGSTALQASLRTIATTAPLAGALLLAWATTRTAGSR
ncbi:MAG TPA: phosphatidylglycerol lysyltransferase domain-containing protein [Polyangiaceae bacterium]